MKPVCEKFTSVEEFWTIFELLPPCDQLDACNVCFFIKDVSPEWEDPIHQGGSTLTIDLPPKSGQSIWKNYLMDMIGHSIPNIEIISGCVLKKRRKEKKARLTIWMTRDVTEKTSGAVARYLKDLCGIEALEKKIPKKESRP
ncbi:Translation Initiation factor eIF- 4e like protein [Aduncisulcus paluster]|uniref:Translation Initiation factor eIF- 4e like protein n=1 Tax=Aduncisulcus paluster TaxID=2918883 RepID=A0ABQ5KYM6_9EUKA|nr:Translation Initiation factor eIF- 4e like protein [Aduncisulcus paluster]